MCVMGFFKNIKTSIDDRSSMSVNSITLLVSALVGFLIGLVVCFVLIYDVITNGHIKTDLMDLGIFLLASGGYIAGSGIPKAFVDSRLKTRSWVENEKMQIDAQDEVERHRSTKKYITNTSSSVEIDTSYGGSIDESENEFETRC